MTNKSCTQLNAYILKYYDIQIKVIQTGGTVPSAIIHFLMWSLLRLALLIIIINT